MGRCWAMMMVASMGVAPAFCGPCCLKTHGDRQAFLEAAFVQPWATATPTEPAGWLAQAISDEANPGNDEPLQMVLDTLFYTIGTAINSQIDVYNPWGWADLGRPR
jgi:hypothetical protein